MKNVYENPKIALDYEDSLKRRKEYCEFETQYLKKEVRDGFRILDLGCGIARHAVLFGNLVNYIGIDISKKMIEIGKNKLRLKNINAKLVQGDLKKFDEKIDGKFDLILLMYHTLGCIELKKDRLKLFKKIRDRLKDNGFLIIHVHNRNHIKNIKFLIYSLFSFHNSWNKEITSGNLVGAIIHFFSKKELKSELKESGFKIIEITPLEYPQEGKIAKGFKKFFLTGGYIFKVKK